MDPLWNKITDELVEKHGCHTVIAYGSRARDEGADTSDYDVAGFRSRGGRTSDARDFYGEFLDAHIYEDSDAEILENFLKLHEGVVLYETKKFGTRLLENIARVYERGPKRLDEAEVRLRRTWARKMLIRITAGDVEGNYRRVSLLTKLLEDYFAIRGEWFRGAKKGFQWLEENDRVALARFSDALEPGTPNSALKRLVAYVYEIE